MLAFLRFVYKAIVIVATVALFGSYFVLINRPYLGRNVLFTPPGEGGGDGSKAPAAGTGPTSRSLMEEDHGHLSDFGRDQLKYNLIRRYWILWNSPLNSTVRDEKFFTPERLADLSSFYLLRPPPEDSFRPWPSYSVFKNDDRVVAQLVLGLEGLPDSYVIKTKTIGLLDGFRWWNYGDSGDLKQDPSWCPAFRLNDCQLVDLRTRDLRSYFTGKKRNNPPDAVIASHNAASGTGPEALREDFSIPDSTKLIYFLLESPYVFDAEFASPNDWINSYWRNADINTPYAKWAYYDPNVTASTQTVNYAATKLNVSSTEAEKGNATRTRRFAAIFMSNCRAHNARNLLVNILKKHIPLDVYGSCGDLQCSRSNEAECFRRLQKEYKFYLAFENANCHDYITEKFFQNALNNNVIPVVLGAHPDDYRTLAPTGSYIQVEDYSSVQELASYLKYLDGNDDAYNSYFAWKGTGQFLDTKYFCRVCAMLHYVDYLESRGIDWERASARATGQGDGDVTSWNAGAQCANEGHVFWNRSKLLFRFGGDSDNATTASKAVSVSD